MRKFLINVTIYAVIIIIILGIGEIVARNMPSSYRYKADWMNHNASDVNTLILGSSHAYYGINSMIFGDGAFNLANVSQTPEQDLMLFTHYADSLSNLKRVILSVSYFTFVDPPLEKSDEWFRIKDYKIQMGLTDHSDFSKYNFEISDLEGYTAKIKSLWQHTRSNTCDSLGNGTGYTLAARAPDWNAEGKVASRVRHTTISPDSATAKQTEKYMRKLLDEFKKRDIECVIVTTPVWYTYYERMDQEQLRDMYRRIESISKDYGAQYLDYINHPDFTASDFYDVDHLSDLGAIKLAKLICKELPPGS